MSSALEKHLTPTALRIRKSPIRLIMQRAAKIEGEVTKLGGGQPQSSLVRSVLRVSINSRIRTRIVITVSDQTQLVDRSSNRRRKDRFGEDRHVNGTELQRYDVQ